MEHPRQEILLDAALQWLVLLQDADATAEERAAFAAWRARGPEHERAWQRAQAVWSRSSLLEPVVRASRRRWAGHATSPRPARPSRRRWLQAAAAAALAIAGGRYLLGEARLFADYATDVGERRTVQLPDGSEVELASSSALSLDFSPDARRVELHSGEAFFDIAADPARPFLVEAGGGRTRALGTAFDVKRRNETVGVAVVEHAVAVSLDDGRSVTLEAGQQIRYDDERLGSIRPANLSQVQAWRRDRLIFQDAPLGEVIADLARYRSGHIVITDARLDALPVTAVFDVRQTDAALDTIADSLPVEVRRLTDLLVLLSPAG